MEFHVRLNLLRNSSLVGPSVTNAEFLLVPSNSSNVHSITVTCTINPESTAEQCEVMAIPTSGGANLSGSDHMIVHVV